MVNAKTIGITILFIEGLHRHRSWADKALRYILVVSSCWRSSTWLGSQVEDFHARGSLKTIRIPKSWVCLGGSFEGDFRRFQKKFDVLQDIYIYMIWLFCHSVHCLQAAELRSNSSNSNHQQQHFNSNNNNNTKTKNQTNKTNKKQTKKTNKTNKQTKQQTNKNNNKNNKKPYDTKVINWSICEKPSWGWDVQKPWAPGGSLATARSRGALAAAFHRRENRRAKMRGSGRFSRCFFFFVISWFFRWFLVFFGDFGTFLYSFPKAECCAGSKVTFLFYFIFLWRGLKKVSFFLVAWRVFVFFVYWCFTSTYLSDPFWDEKGIFVLRAGSLGRNWGFWPSMDSKTWTPMALLICSTSWDSKAWCWALTTDLA